MTTTLTERVERGVKLLDEKKPGWAQSIELSTLRMTDRRDCVLGKVYGYYGDGLTELELSGSQFDNDTGAPYGFDLTMQEWRDDNLKLELDSAWRQIIANRQSA